MKSWEEERRGSLTWGCACDEKAKQGMGEKRVKGASRRVQGSSKAIRKGKWRKQKGRNKSNTED